jgi:sugar phosphate isomerase/epimerase
MKNFRHTASASASILKSENRATAMHERISIHQMCFANMALSNYVQQCQTLGATRIGLISPALLASNGLVEARLALCDTELKVQTIAHVFKAGHLSADRGTWQDSRESLTRLIDIAATLNANSIYMLTGGHGGLSWENAADCFSATIAPCIDQAKAAGVELAIENASALYADIHIAHSLADTIALAEMAGIGVCIELFFCWAEANLPALFARAMPRCQLVQVSDYIYGDRSLPARAVPGDGSIPLSHILKLLLDAGYKGAFDLELLGPRIDAEGPANAVARAASHVGTLLTNLKA